jgi:hypothetical protein
VVGGSAGAINPKTLQKFIWPFIEAIAELTSDVVSLLRMIFGRKLHPTSQMIHFFVLDCFWGDLLIYIRFSKSGLVGQHN